MCAILECMSCGSLIDMKAAVSSMMIIDSKFKHDGAMIFTCECGCRDFHACFLETNQ